MVPRTVLTRSGPISLKTTRPINIVQPRIAVNNAGPLKNVTKVNTAKPKAVVNIPRSKAVLSAVKGNKGNAVKASACSVWKPKTKVIDHVSKHNSTSMLFKRFDYVDAQGRSKHMTRNRSYLTDYEEIDRGFIAFGGNSKSGKITRKGKIRTGKLDFKDVYFVKELKFNLFNVSQMCDKKNSVLFTDTEYVVLSPDFKLTDESHVLLKVSREDNMYSVDLKNVVPQGGLTCLFAKATPDESNLWHRIHGHVNFKTMNKLVKGNLVRVLPSKLFEINQTCVACQKGKQQRASCKTKTVTSISQPLQMLHMDLFGPTFVKSLMKKMYCLVVTDDFNLRVKVIRCDNRTEFKNKVMNQFYEMKGIKREFSVARTPQQNEVAERKNKTLIEVARTMLADSKLPTTFWAEAVNTACYVQNRVLVIKPHNKTPYELFLGRKHALSFMKPFGCPVTILNTLDHLGKFIGKANEGFFVGYFTNSKAFRVFNSRTRIVEENLHVKFNENTPNIAGNGPKWLFDIDTLTKSMNYKPFVVWNQSNGSAGIKVCDSAGKARVESIPSKDYILLPLWTQDLQFSSSSKDSPYARFKPLEEEEKKDAEDPRNKDSEVPSTEEPRANQENDANVNITNNINTISLTDNVVGIEDNVVDENIVYGCANDPNMPNLEEIVYSDDDDDVDAEAGMNNLYVFIPVSSIPTTSVHKDHPVEQIIRDLNSAPQTRRMTKKLEEHGLFSFVQQRTNHKDFQNCLFACFLSQVEPKKVWTLVDLPYGKRAIGKKWVYRNKKDERGTVIRNKARLVAQGYTQEEGIDYDEVFSPVARIEAIRLFLAYASFKDFVVYHMDVKSAFLYGKIEEVYVCQPPWFEDLEIPDRVYKVEKTLYGLHQASRAWYETLSTYLLDNGFQRGQIDKTLFIKKVKGNILLVQVYVDDIIFGYIKKVLCTEFEKLMHNKFQMSSMGKVTFFLGLQVTKKDDGIFISQDKYVTEILKKFGFSDVKTASTPMETHKPLLKDADREDVDEHLYRSMIGSLMYLTSSRPDIMFSVCAYARYQVNPKASHLHDVKRIFRYLKGQPKLGLLYPKDSPFDLVAYTDSDYAGASLDRKSTTRAEYIAASNCCGQFWATAKAKTVNEERHIRALVDNRMVIITETSVRSDLQLDDAEGTECLPNDAIFEQLTLMGAKTTTWNEFSSTMASAIILFLNKQLGDMSTHKEIYVTPSYTKKIFANMKREGKGFSGMVTPLFQTMMVQDPEEVEPIPDEVATEEHEPTHSNDPLLSGEDRLKLTELIKLYTNLQKKVLDLKEAKTAQLKEIPGLKKRVKKLEKKRKSRTLGLKRLRKVGSARRLESSDKSGLGDQEDASKQGRKIADIDQDAEVTLIDETQGRSDDNLMFKTCVLDKQEVEVEKVVSIAKVTTASAITTTVDELTLAQTLIEIKAAKPKAVTTEATSTTTAVIRPKARGVVVQEPSEFKTTTSPLQSSQLLQAKDKGKAKMVEPEKPLKKKDQIIQKKEEANIALIESWDNTQVMMEADFQLAQQLHVEEQEQLSIEEKLRLFIELIDKRKKHFAKLRAEKQRRKPPTKAQKRNTMSTYLKIMAGHKHNQLKTKSFKDIQMLFDKEVKRVNTFVDMNTKLVKGNETRTEGSTKRAGDELESNNSNKQKLDEHVEAEIEDDQEEA
ncbi:retrovirus-related pol polyprotein from transposon TNT 1-94 [Tanacetum coccineum]